MKVSVSGLDALPSVPPAPPATSHTLLTYFARVVAHFSHAAENEPRVPPRGPLKDPLKGPQRCCHLAKGGGVHPIPPANFISMVWGARPMEEF